MGEQAAAIVTGQRGRADRRAGDDEQAGTTVRSAHRIRFGRGPALPGTVAFAVSGAARLPA